MRRSCRSRRVSTRPERLSLDDPSFERQLQRALSLSLQEPTSKQKGPSGVRRLGENVVEKRRRLDPESSGSERTEDCPAVVFEPTEYVGVERSSVRWFL